MSPNNLQMKLQVGTRVVHRGVQYTVLELDWRGFWWAIPKAERLRRVRVRVLREGESVWIPAHEVSLVPFAMQ